MRIGLITDSYAPLNNSAAVHMHDLAKELVLQGHSVVVLVPDPTLTSPYEIEREDNLVVFRARTMDMRNGSNIHRAIAEILLSFTMWWRMRQSKFWAEPLDAVIWYSPSIFWGWLVNRLKKSQKIKTYLILRDIFPEWAVDLGIMNRGIAYKFFKILEKYQYKQADTIAIQSEKARPYLRNILGNNTPSIEYLLCWMSDLEITKAPFHISDTPLAGRKICVYTGNIGLAQDADVFLDLAKTLTDRTDIGFLFVGRGSEMRALRQRTSDENLDNVLIKEEVNSDLLPGLLDQCHVGLVSLRVEHKTDNIPGKFLGYTRSGLPVLASLNTGNDLNDTIFQQNLGISTNLRDINALRAGLLKLLGTPEEYAKCVLSARAYFDLEFKSETAAKRIIESLTVE